MNKFVSHIVIVGGGSAGWLTAAMVAADHQHRIVNKTLTVTLCESANIASIGVGEGTWPTMVQTLHRIGLKESDFITQCQASFKQGSKFINWQSNKFNSHYYHPFEVPDGAPQGILAEGWLTTQNPPAFAECFSVQPELAEQYLAPKPIAAPEFGGELNYGYHLDACRFVELLKTHCIQRLGVKHVVNDVTDVKLCEQGNITAVSLGNGQLIEGDLFVDCSGFQSLLLGKACGIKNTDVSDVLFANRALAVQGHYPSVDAPINSFTHSTAQDAGWIWDIGLQNRRGIGYVYSSSHLNDTAAEETLSNYLSSQNSCVMNDFRLIKFNSGYKQKFWHNNCLAIGLSAGFIEPLEASALVMIELSASMLSEQLPKTSVDIAIVRNRFNKTFSYRWQRIIEFLKLHYVLSERSTDFWQDNRQEASIPERLQELLALWQHNLPMQHDFDRTGEIFHTASYQYVLYGSGFKTQLPFGSQKAIHDWTGQQFHQNQQRKMAMVKQLPSNRALLQHIHQFGLARS